MLSAFSYLTLLEILEIKVAFLVFIVYPAIQEENTVFFI